MTITGRRRTELKSVKGTETNAMSPCLGIVPILIIQSVAPKISAGGCRLDKIARFRRRDQDFNGCSKRKRHVDFQLPSGSHLCFELENALVHFISLYSLFLGQKKSFLAQPPLGGRPLFRSPARRVYGPKWRMRMATVLPVRFATTTKGGKTSGSALKMLLTVSMVNWGSMWPGRR